MIIVQMEYSPGSADLPPFISWIARIDVNTYDCKGVSLKQSKKCKSPAKFLYVNRNGSIDFYCRNHLDIYKLNASLYGKDATEEKRCERWIRNHTTDTRGLLK